MDIVKRPSSIGPAPSEGSFVESSAASLKSTISYAFLLADGEASVVDDATSQFEVCCIVIPK